ncbi:MAG: hypothetical protein IKL85_00645 [Lentisphaeria bacterium]|nr:hypothetical protein [Lentisphaeria bacterium]
MKFTPGTNSATVAFIASSNFGQIMDGARWRAEFEAFNETGDSFLDVLD